LQSNYLTLASPHSFLRLWRFTSDVCEYQEDGKEQNNYTCMELVIFICADCMN